MFLGIPETSTDPERHGCERTRSIRYSLHHWLVPDSQPGAWSCVLSHGQGTLGPPPHSKPTIALGQCRMDRSTVPRCADRCRAPVQLTGLAPATRRGKSSPWRPPRLRSPPIRCRRHRPAPRYTQRWFDQATPPGRMSQTPRRSRRSLVPIVSSRAPTPDTRDKSSATDSAIAQHSEGAVRRDRRAEHSLGRPAFGASNRREPRALGHADNERIAV
jgi:hypothetical protein